jgi:DNA replication protein DnaC
MNTKECKVFEKNIVKGNLEDFVDFWDVVSSNEVVKEKFIKELVDKNEDLFISFAEKTLSLTASFKDISTKTMEMYERQVKQNNGEKSEAMVTAMVKFGAFAEKYCESVVELTNQAREIAPESVELKLMEIAIKHTTGQGAKVANEEVRVIKMFFPPEVAESIMRDLGLQSQTVVPGKKDPEPQKKRAKIKFNFDMVSTSKDLKVLIEKLKNSKTKAFSLLLYGAPGCGKSYLAEYLAQELGLNILKKKASDMLSRFVGDTEKQITAAFKEAVDTNSLLILDEADSLLTDRSKAKQDFQVSSVNTMLTCMEEHPLPFVCTTNLKDWLDKASMRRFIFKIKYDEMGHKQIQAGVHEYFSKRIKLTEEDTKDLKHITAGDFPVVKKKLDILEDGKYTKENILEQLKEEQAEKGIFEPKVIGF